MVQKFTNNSSALQLVTTADQSLTVFNSVIGEHYHSVNGALQESEHVFLNSGLRYYLADKDIKEVSILEVGFGTGLNFLLSADYCAAKQIRLAYTGIEAHPLAYELISQTGYNNYLSKLTWQQFLAIYTSALSDNIALNDFVNLNIETKLLEYFNTSKQFDIIYFDAFASAVQPEMWTNEMIAHTVKFLKPNGLFVTYAITGNLKRALKSYGFKIEKALGAAGKREMLRALKLA